VIDSGFTRGSDVVMGITTQRRSSAALTLAAVVVLGCSGGKGTGGTGASSGAGGSGGAGGGALPEPCPAVANPTGTVVDSPWPALVNTGHESLPGDTVRFQWTGTHDVVQVASFAGQTPADASWPARLSSGAEQKDAAFDWNLGTFPCGYRPGLYYFVDEGDDLHAVIAISVTDTDGAHYAQRSCKDLTGPGVYGGRYAGYAGRDGCTVFEVNNFQTATHYDWVQPALGAQQGDLILFRWTGSHNIVQVHDATLDVLFKNGVTSGPKTNCAGGPQYTCANGPPELGEYLIDTTDYRPGLIHISDEGAMQGVPTNLGMNMQYGLKLPRIDGQRPTPADRSCCALDPSKGDACHLIDLYDDWDGEQFDGNVGVNRGDLVRFRWGGKVRLYQSLPDANGQPTETPDPSPKALHTQGEVECTPGPHMSCLEGTTDQAELRFDVDAQIAAGNFTVLPTTQQKAFTFYATVEGAAPSKILIYVNEGPPYDPHPPACSP
jgi:hypothetical protein